MRIETDEIKTQTESIVKSGITKEDFMLWIEDDLKC